MKELIYLVITFSNIFSYLIFPLNIEYKEITSSDNPKQIIDKLSSCSFYVTVNIGSEKTHVKAYVTQSNTEFSIGGQNIKNHKYNESASISYNCTNKEIQHVEYGTYLEGLFSTDNFNIKNDKNEIQIVQNLDFILGTKPKYNDVYEGEMGLHLPYQQSFSNYNFILSLNRANATKTCNWFFDFDNFPNGEGIMVVDALPHNLHKKKYGKNIIANISAIDRGYTSNWGIIFNSIYYEDSYFILSKMLETHIEFNTRIISAPNDAIEMLEKLFFNKYLEDNICFKETFGNYNEIFFYCKNTNKFNVKEFKSIYFKNVNLEIIFELDYKDLFYYKNNYIIFLITFKKDSTIWALGELFYKKYNIFFNQKSKILGYYQGMEKEKEKSNFKFSNIILIILLVLILISIIVVGLIIYMKIKKPRKNRANELEDNYEYEPKINNTEENKKKLIDENNIN